MAPLPISHCRPSPAISTRARPSRSGSSTATSSRSRSRCCRWLRSARSSVIGASIWRALPLFTLASLFCTLSHSLPTLTVARIVQGFGAAGIMSVNTALVRFIYPRERLGRGIGVNAMVVAVSAAIGPTVAAGILAIATWPYLFAVNLPIGLAALALGIALSAACTAREPWLRLAKRCPQRRHVRLRHRGNRQPRSWRGVTGLYRGIRHCDRFRRAARSTGKPT